MVLIDSPTDLMATAGRQIPKVITRLENFNDPSTFRTDVNNRRFENLYEDDYLKGAYRKRVEELEQFAKDKNFWASTELDYEYEDAPESEKYEVMEKNALRKRRLEGRVSRPRLGNRRRLVAQRRQQDFERDSSGIYDYVDPLSFQDIYGSPSTYSEDRFTPLSEQFPLQPQQNPDSLTRRVANAIFNPVSSTIFAIVAVPLILAAVYWLFVVNGPTPVVKARIEDADELALHEVDEQPQDFKLDELAIKILKAFVPVVQQE